MKKYIYLIPLALFISMSVQAQKEEKNVNQILKVFPYHHASEVADALTTMGTWKSAEWEVLFKMLDDDSLKLKATYALNAYVNIVSLENAKKVKTVQLLKKQLNNASTDYATTLINAQIGLLSAESLVTAKLQSLPSIPKVATTKQVQQNTAQQLLQLQDQMDKLKVNGNDFQKKSLLIQAAKIPSLGALVFVSQFLAETGVQKEAALIVTRLALANHTISGPIVRQALEQALPLISGEDSALLVPKLKAHLKKMPYDYGFVSLFNERI